MTELVNLKPHDEIQSITNRALDKGYPLITTAGHGYLVVPKGDKNYSKALQIVSYGYKGELAIYLEEDCEAGEFLDKLD